MNRIYIINWKIRLLISLSMITLSFLLMNHTDNGWYFTLFLLGIGFFNFTSEKSEELKKDKQWIREQRLKKVLDKKRPIK